MYPNRSPALVSYAFGLSKVCNKLPSVTSKIYALPEPVPPASPSSGAPTMARLPDIDTESPKKSFASAPYAFGLSNVCNKLPSVTSKIYALPEPVPPASSSLRVPTIARLPDIATDIPNSSL